MARLVRPIFVPLMRPVRNFFDQRLPRQDHHQLSQRNVYVFFSQSGLLFLLLLALTFVTGTNYSNNLILGLCFYLGSIWLVTAVMTHWQISPLSIRLIRTSLAQQGGLLWVDIELANRKGRTSRQLELYFDDPNLERLVKDQTLYEQHRCIHLSVVDSPVHIRLPVVAAQRGRLTLPRLTVRSVYPLGIVRSWAYMYFGSHGLCYPRPLPFDWQIHKAQASGHERETSAITQAGQEDFDMLDHYVVGESLGRVSWGHLARGMGMLTKRFVTPIGDEHELNYAHMPATTHEDKLAQLAYAVLELGATGEAFGMVLPDDHPDHLTVGSGDAFVNTCLMRLAKA